MTRTKHAVARLDEIVDVLRAHLEIACTPTIAEDDGLWTLALTFVAGDDPSKALRILELATALQRVADVAQMRGFAEHYEIPSEKLEALLLGPEIAAMRNEIRTARAGDDRVREITAEIAARFNCFNPLTHALRDQPASFAAGVDVAAVVRFVIERLETRDGE